MSSSRYSKDLVLISGVGYLLVSILLTLLHVDISGIANDLLIRTHRLSVIEARNPEVTYLPSYITIMLLLQVPLIAAICVHMRRNIGKVALLRSRKSYILTSLTSMAVAAASLYATLFGGTVGGGISQRTRWFEMLWYLNDFTIGLIFFLMLWFFAMMVSISYLCAVLACQARY